MSHTATSRERILAAATRLFAEQGYHGVSTRALAQAAGLNIATVHHHMGGKRELYLAVLEQLYGEEEAVIEAFRPAVEAAAADPDPAGLREVFHQLADRLIALFAEDRHRAALYVRRWTAPPEERSPEEARLSLQMYRRLASLLETARKGGHLPPTLDGELFLRSLDWIVLGYFVTGPVDLETWRGDPVASDAIDRFRRFLYGYIDQMFRMPSGEQHAGD